MLGKTLWSCLLVALTVSVHAGGLSSLLKVFVSAKKTLPTQFWPITWFLVRVSWFLLLIHMLEIVIWGVFYTWSGAVPDPETAFYFSAVTYATIGYGDVVLPEYWRILSPIEGLTGILMCGLSTGIFFVVVTRLFTDLKPRSS